MLDTKRTAMSDDERVARSNYRNLMAWKRHLDRTNEVTTSGAVGGLQGGTLFGGSVLGYARDRRGSFGAMVGGKVVRSPEEYVKRLRLMVSGRTEDLKGSAYMSLLERIKAALGEDEKHYMGVQRAVSILRATGGWLRRNPHSMDKGQARAYLHDMGWSAAKIASAESGKNVGESRLGEIDHAAAFDRLVGKMQAGKYNNFARGKRLQVSRVFVKLVQKRSADLNKQAAAAAQESLLSRLDRLLEGGREHADYQNLSPVGQHDSGSSGDRPMTAIDPHAHIVGGSHKTKTKTKHRTAFRKSRKRVGESGASVFGAIAGDSSWDYDDDDDDDVAPQRVPKYPSRLQSRAGAGSRTPWHWLQVKARNASKKFRQIVKGKRLREEFYVFKPSYYASGHKGTGKTYKTLKRAQSAAMAAAKPFAHHTKTHVMDNQGHVHWSTPGGTKDPAAESVSEIDYGAHYGRLVKNLSAGKYGTGSDNTPVRRKVAKVARHLVQGEFRAKLRRRGDAWSQWESLGEKRKPRPRPRAMTSRIAHALKHSPPDPSIVHPHKSHESAMMEIDAVKHFSRLKQQAHDTRFTNLSPKKRTQASRVAIKLAMRMPKVGEARVSELDYSKHARSLYNKEQAGKYDGRLRAKANRVGSRVYAKSKGFPGTRMYPLGVNRRKMGEANNGSKILGVQLAKQKGGHLYTISPEIADLVGRMDMVIPKGMNESDIAQRLGRGPAKHDNKFQRVMRDMYGQHGKRVLRPALSMSAKDSSRMRYYAGQHSERERHRERYGESVSEGPGVDPKYLARTQATHLRAIVAKLRAAGVPATYADHNVSVSGAGFKASIGYENTGPASNGERAAALMMQLDDKGKQFRYGGFSRTGKDEPVGFDKGVAALSKLTGKQFAFKPHFMSGGGAGSGGRLTHADNFMGMFEGKAKDGKTPAQRSKAIRAHRADVIQRVLSPQATARSRVLARRRAEVDDETTCPSCGRTNGPESHMGNLGRMAHFRCRGCGMDYNHKMGESVSEMTGHTHVVTVKHDRGTKNIRVRARSTSHAAQVVMAAERCPRNAITGIRKLGEGAIKPMDGSFVRAIKAGDRVTIAGFKGGSNRTGRAVMPSSHGGWVLNMGGAHGTPSIADDRNIVSVSRSNKGKGDSAVGSFIRGLDK